MSKAKRRDPWGKDRETDREWWARGGYKAKGELDGIDCGIKWMEDPHPVVQAVQPDKTRRPSRTEGPSNAPHMPEHDLWEAVLYKAVDDATGGRHANHICSPCRDEWIEEHGNHSKFKPEWPRHTNQECAIASLQSDWMATICSLVGIEVSYFRRLAGL